MGRAENRVAPNTSSEAFILVTVCKGRRVADKAVDGAAKRYDRTVPGRPYRDLVVFAKDRSLSAHQRIGDLKFKISKEIQKLRAPGSALALRFYSQLPLCAEL